MTGPRALRAAACPHWAATEVGEDVLRRGGNALDACVAMNAMLAVVYPHMCGLGGDMFLLYHEGVTGEMHCLNATGRSPSAATIAAVRERGLEAMPARGALSVNVPGAVSGWEEALARFGSRTLGELLEPAIGTASSGFEVTARLEHWIGECATDLRADPVLRRLFFDADGAPLSAGARLRLPQLADTLGLLAREGAAAFYTGDIAAEIERACLSAGGLLTAADLAAHRNTWPEPAHVPYRGLDLYTTPPNSQGITALEMLNILDCESGTHDLEIETTEWVARFVRAKHAAFADRNRYVTDPAFADVPVRRLTSVEHAARRLADPGIEEEAYPVAGDTVYLCATDDDGNACSLIQSIYYPFGAGVVAGDTGIILHNRGHYFSLDPGHVNRLEPSKRTLHTLMASMALREGRPWLVFGTMGADGQPQFTVQVLERVLRGADPQAAVDAPRVLSGRFALEDDIERLVIEESFDAAAVQGLRERGHDVLVVPALHQRMGHSHAILIDGEGVAHAGADPRSDGRRPA
jgi:gamma-glutamyltranspeptidase/glutathione hydrolase